ncbi:putative F-box protein At3g52320 [Daucus carota subsp. sativus]|uniref:putative F-box protein At3g52320 n=1 Tax=Daucus carota subsp. sativus TaxID=79200 RepID=UPI0007EF65DF|nr:PREDICTED: putative F-box protein At3g52320 [Daucus carota subsp. sativus]
MYLPTHLLIDIFCRLEVRSLVQCTCVSKTWYQVIHSTSLANTHLTYQKTSSANKYVLHQDSRSCTLLTNWEPLLDSTNHSKHRYTPELFEKNINIFEGCQLKIHGFCDGLLCISRNGVSDNNLREFNSGYRVGDNLHLWNPICRKAKKLPELRISDEYDWLMRKGGVSFGHYDHDYKVIVISTIGNIFDVFVYSLSTNSWNIIHTNYHYEDEIVDFCVVPEPTKFVDGIAYMITDTFRYGPGPQSIVPLAVCFDVRNETIQQFRCPEEFIKYRTQFAMEAFGESVAVLGCDDGSGFLDMWNLVKDEFSSESRWEKRLVIKLQEVGFSVPVGLLCSGKYLVRTIVFLEYREQVTNFFLYDLESLEVTRYKSPEDYPDYLCIINSNCEESLLLLDEDSVNPFVHKETESSCSSMVFTLQNAIAKTLPIPVNVHYGRKQKSRKKKMKSLYDNGSVHGPEMLELTEDYIAVKFASGLSNLASLSLSISYPSIAAASCMFSNAYKNVLALSLATDYTYKQAEKVEEFLKDLSK